MSTTELQQQPHKQRKANLVYNIHQRFENLMLAQEATKKIELEGSKLVYVDERETKSCKKINYRCKKGCPVRYYLTLHPESDIVTSYLSNNQHVHIKEV